MNNGLFIFQAVDFSIYTAKRRGDERRRKVFEPFTKKLEFLRPKDYKRIVE